MIKIELTVWERLQLLGAIRVTQTQLDIVVMRQWLRVIDVLDLSVEEKKAVGFAEAFDSDGNPLSITWTDDVIIFDLEFDDTSARLLSAAPGWRCWRPDVRTLALLEKLEAL